ncbi:hypothetical protein CPB85DRAFT_1362254 [Mucidula mucida]|nr:hypothetical protein CPB85DRAFT_1362254 [Mucidula mucida]
MSGIFSGDDVLGPASQTPIVIFDSLACVSSCSMGLFILTTRMNPNIRRTRAWYIMSITLTVFPLLYLTNAGYQFQSNDPPFGLCLFQAALSMPTLTINRATLAVFCYMLDVALSVHAAMSHKTRSKFSFRVLSWLPSAMFMLMYTFAVMVSAPNVTFDSERIARTSASFTILSLAGMLITEVWIIVMLVKAWRNKQLNQPGEHALQISVTVRFVVGRCVQTVAL